MKIYTLFTPSHRFFFENYFLKTFPFDDRIELKVLFKKQLGDAEFHGNGWRDTMYYKTQCFIEAAQEVGDQGIFMFIDPDIQFFKPFYDDILNYMNIYDAVFQDDYVGGANTGFFAIRSTAKTRLFLQMVQDELHNWPEEQQCFNHTLKIFHRYPELTFKVSRLPRKYWTYGEFNANWNGEENFDIPHDIVMHHANWTKPFSNKIKLLDLVRKKHEKLNT